MDFFTTERVICLLLFAALAAVIWLAMWYEDFDGMRSSWRFYREVKKRSPLEFEEFYREFYAGSGVDEQIVRRMLEVHGGFASVKPERIRPDDNFARVFDLPFDEVLQDIEEEFAIRFRDEDLPNLDGSFDSLVRYVARRVDEAKRDA